MTQKHDMTAPKMTRVTVRVPSSTLDQINEWVDALGVRRSHFLGIALVAGVRSLIRASALEMTLGMDANGPLDDNRGDGIGQMLMRHDSAGGEGLASHQGRDAELVSLRAQVKGLKEQLDRLLPTGGERP